MTSASSRPRRHTWLAASLLAIGVIGAAGYLLLRPRLPAQGSEKYEAMSREFYRGLAALDVGLLDTARQDFARSTQIVPEEPAGWANLGLSLIRLGDANAAAEPIGRAVQLAPRDSQVAMLAGRMEIGRGQLDAGLAQLKRAAQLDPRDLRARFAVAEQIESGGLTPDSRREAETLYDELLAQAPDNLVLLVERARLAASDDIPRSREMVRRLEALAGSWPPEATLQLQDVKRALDASNATDLVRGLTRLRNVLARVPAYRESLAAVRTPSELIAEPFTRFLVLENPTPQPAAEDAATSFTQESAGDQSGLAAVTVAALDANAPVAIIPRAAVAIDWNRDFRTDLVEADAAGLRLYEQDQRGQMMDATTSAAAGEPFACGCFAAWAADIELDGDLDLVVGRIDGPTVVLRNNGDGTWRQLQTFEAVSRARGFAWGDVDGDADPDAVFVDDAGDLHVFINRQAGQFAELPVLKEDALAVAIADANADGSLDVVTINGSGSIIARTWRGSQWTITRLADWPDVRGASPGTCRVFLADLDNNGALDVLVSGPSTARVWLADQRLRFEMLSTVINAGISGIADLNGDGLVDLAGVSGGRPVRLLNTGTARYHWTSIRARAQDTAGDQRINAFGIGGDVQVRSGLLVQKQLLTDLPAHFGLGRRATIDVARIVWPNGVPQAEFDARVDSVIVAEQRLKGSCPWLFTWDGRKFTFVTDFLWRSPLGLRINAQDTAGTTQTEDWVRIRHDQLQARDGLYDVRITAELWETHYFDHVSLMAVDHPADVDVFVDERFSPARPQARVLRAVEDLEPVAAAHDDRGRDVLPDVAALDGRYLTSFARGDYQGIAQEHYVEIEIGDRVRRHDRLVLIAQGWVYPTDSSINVAIGQHRADQPRGLALEAQDGTGRWRVVDPDLGFPAGKNKTMVIDLGGARDARRFRLRTNLEVYWDALRVGSLADSAIRTQRLTLSAADLRFRGFSVTTSPRGDAPETADYARLANTTTRWRDLEGYYTRYGDIRELLAGVDDRYVIMNAGDEMRLRFIVPAALTGGWQRDFVLIGDGWEKDGDYNTDYSNTVTPLPSHAHAEYRAPSASAALEDDPVYREHRDDWDTFHTRYVTPAPFLRGLR